MNIKNQGRGQIPTVGIRVTAEIKMKNPFKMPMTFKKANVAYATFAF